MRVIATVACAALLLTGCELPNPYGGTPTPTPVPVPAPTPTPPTGEPPTTPVEPTPAPTPLPPPPVTRTYKLGAAAQSLVTTAHTQIAKGDLDAASGTLDRALRIEPRNPLLWIELGRLRLEQKQPKQAESYGRKALALATGDKRAQSQANAVIAEAVKAQGRAKQSGTP